MWILLLLLPMLACAQPNALWTRIISADGDMDARVIGAMDDGGFFLAGRVQTAVSEFPGLYLARLDEDGNTLWQRTYATNSPDSHVAAVRTPDGGFILAGSMQVGDEPWPRLILLRTDAEGDSLWASTFSNDTLGAFGTACGLWNDGSFWAAGHTQLADGRSPGVVVMFDANGDSLHCAFFWGAASGVRIAAGAYLYDHHFLFVGATQRDVGGPFGFWLARVDSLGEWTFQGYGVPNWGESGYTSLARCIINPIIVGGTSTYQDSSGDFDCSRFWYGNSPYQLWTRSLGTEARDECLSTAVLPDTTSLFGGSSDVEGLGSQFSLYRLDENGDVLWQLLWGDTDEEQINSLTATADGGFAPCGSKRSGDLPWRIYVARYASVMESPSRPVTSGVSFQLLPNYPNPFNASTLIPFRLERATDVKLDVLDVTGRHVRTLVAGRLEAGRHAILLRREELASGTYLCRLTSPAGSDTRRITLLK